MEGKICPKTSFQVLERQKIENQAIFELYTDDNKLKYSSNHKDILKSVKEKKRKKSTSSELLSFENST